MNIENLVIDMCEKKDLSEIIKLSNENVIKMADGKVSEVGISKPIIEEDFNYIVVAKSSGKIVGALVAVELDEDDREWYKVKDKDSSITIMKIFVSKSFRGNGVAGQMISFVKQKFKNKEIYVDIMAAPQKNNSSRRAFEKQGFKLIREEPYYFKEINLNTSWWILKYSK